MENDTILRKYFKRMKNAVIGVTEYSLPDLIKLWVDKKVIIGDSDGLDIKPTQKKALVNIEATSTKPKGRYIDLKPLRDFIERSDGVVSMQEVLLVINGEELPDMSFEEMGNYLVKKFKK